MSGLIAAPLACAYSTNERTSPEYEGIFYTTFLLLPVPGSSSSPSSSLALLPFFKNVCEKRARPWSRRRCKFLRCNYTARTSLEFVRALSRLEMDGLGFCANGERPAPMWRLECELTPPNEASCMSAKNFSRRNGVHIWVDART